MKKTQKARRADEPATAARDKQQPAAAERPGSWHLARTETERRLSEFEFGLERLAQAYYRWKAACLAAVCDVPLTGDDVAVLNVVRMGDEPKRLSRDRAVAQPRRCPQSAICDAQAGEGRPDRDRGLVIAQGNALPRDRDRAHDVTEAYAALRAATLPPMLEALDGWAEKSEATGAHLELVSSLYTQAAQVAITRRHQP